MKHSHPSRRGVLNVIVSAGVAMSLSAWGVDAAAQTRVTYKSAKTGSSYYQMGVEIAQAMKAGTGRQDHRHRRGEPGVGPERDGSRDPHRQLRVHDAAGAGRLRAGRQGAVQGQDQPEVRRHPRAVPDPVADDALRRARRCRHQVVRGPRGQEAADRQGQLRRHGRREVSAAVRPRRQGPARRRRAQQRGAGAEERPDRRLRHGRVVPGAERDRGGRQHRGEHPFARRRADQADQADPAGDSGGHVRGADDRRRHHVAAGGRVHDHTDGRRDRVPADPHLLDPARQDGGERPRGGKA